jgi:hypothetical protein
MYGPKYVWFLAATSSGGWIFSPKTFSRQHRDLRCDHNQVVKAAEGFLTIANIQIRQDNKTTVSGLVSSYISLGDYFFTMVS